MEQHVPEQQQSHRTKRKLSASQDKQLVKKQKLKNKNEVHDGTSLVEEELIKIKQAEQWRKVEDMSINELYACAVILRINNLAAEKNGCRKCKTENVGLFVFISHHDLKKCLMNLKSEEKVAKLFDQAYRTIDHNGMKDKCGRRLQEKQWDINPMSLLVLENTRRPKGFKEKIKNAVLRQLLSE